MLYDWDLVALGGLRRIHGLWGVAGNAPRLKTRPVQKLNQVEEPEVARWSLGSELNRQSLPDQFTYAL